MKRELAVMITKRYGLAIAVLLIMALALVAPASAATVTISPGQSIAGAIASAGSDGVVILNPGVYYENNIDIGSSITLRADTANGHGPWDTIIDGQNNGNRIISVTGGSTSLTIDNLTLRNAYSINANGGAIFANGDSEVVTITSSTFSGCSVNRSDNIGAMGGAIYSSSFSGRLTVTSSTFTGCSVSSSDSHGLGGAISTYQEHCVVTITSSTFTGCSASSSAKNVRGGAIFLFKSATGTIRSSTFTGCSASTRTGDARGGAIFISPYSDPVFTIISSTFTDCSASGSTGTGSAISSDLYCKVAMRFCRIYHNGLGPAVTNYGTYFDAMDNWWGTNSGPAGYTGGSKIITSSPWLVLGVTASPAAVTTAQTATIRVNLTYSNGLNTSGDGHLPDGIPVRFTTSNGAVSPATAYTGSGSATVTFTPTSPGTAYITATVDGQSVTVPVTVTEPGVTATTIVIDPAAPATLYAGLDNEGIYRSTDSGAAWTAATTQPINKQIRALVLNPADHTHLFAGTYGGGVYNSTDSGVTWTACPDTGLTNLNVVSLVTDSSGKLYAGTEAGVFSSTDNCATWTEMNGGLP